MSDTDNKPTSEPTVPPSAPGKRARYGGRQKGAMNKSQYYQKTIHKVLKSLKIDPILALARFVKNLDPATGEEYTQQVMIGRGDQAHLETIIGFNPDIRLSAAKELASFVAPKRKAIEQTVTGGDSVIFQIVTEDKRIADEFEREEAERQEEFEIDSGNNNDEDNGEEES